MTMGMLPARARRPEAGAIAVEFALVMLPLIVLTFGLIQYGLYFWAMQGGSDIARSAARAAAVNDESTRACTAFKADLREQINGLTGSGATATITRTYVDTESPSGVTSGDTVKVSVKFKSINLHFPFVPFIRDGLVTSTGTARLDNADPDNPPATCS
jgi:Flp pilus assembly protein TadG